jgi:hypothetical protein
MQFPVTLKIKDATYILKSVIHYSSGHYVAYVRTIDGLWYLFNDLDQSPASKAKCIPTKSKVCPHLLFYSL